MRLNSIKLSGVKSFAEPTNFVLPGQLIGVVGPNGCGKSNIMDAQHGLHRKRVATAFGAGAAWRKRLNQTHQLRPRHHQIHLIEEHALARPLGNKLESGSGKAGLFHHPITPHRTQRLAGFCRVTLRPAAQGAGISERTARKWLKRFEEFGLQGLFDRSSRPMKTRASINAQLAERIERLRRHRMPMRHIAHTNISYAEDGSIVEIVL